MAARTAANMIALLKRSAYLWHKALHGGPKGIAWPYISLLSAVSRRLPLYMSARIASSIRTFTWPEMTFKPKSVVMPNNVIVSLVPHLGQPDEEALFRNRLDYEAPV